MDGVAVRSIFGVLLTILFFASPLISAIYLAVTKKPGY